MMRCAVYNVPFDDLLKEEDGWYSRSPMTTSQHEIWKAWFLKELKTRFRWSKKLCRKEFVWFDLMYGLKIEDATD